MQAQKQKLERFLKMTQASGCKATWLQGDPGTSTAPCGRSSDRGGVVQRDVSDHQRAAELL